MNVDPDTGLWPVRVDLYYAGEWHDVSDHIDVSNGIQINRGRQDFQSAPSPSRCSLTLINDDGRFVPHNPLSPLYGRVGRNTPIRVRVGEPGTFIRLLGDSTNTFPSYVSTPSSPALDPDSGALDIRMDIWPDSWRPDVAQLVVSRSVWTTGDIGWQVTIRENGAIWFQWSQDGTPALFLSALSPRDADTGRLRVRVVADPDYSPGEFRYLWYIGDESGEWELVESGQGPRPGPIYPADAPLVIGSSGVGGAGWADVLPFSGRVYGLQVRDGSDGPVLADAFAPSVGMSAGDSYVDSAGREWTLYGSVRTGDSGETRFTGHVAAWPQHWVGPESARTEVDAYGVSAALSRAPGEPRSAMFRGVTHAQIQGSVLAYWPMEDEEDSQEFASGIGGRPMRVGRIPTYHIRDIEFASFGEFECSKPIPLFHTTAAVGDVPLVEPTGELRVMALASPPDDGVAVNTTLLSIGTTGTVAEWRLMLTPGGGLITRGFDRSGNLVVDSGGINFQLNGLRRLLGMWLVQNGDDIEWQMFAFPDSYGSGAEWHGTAAGRSLGSATSVAISPYGDLAGTAVGHLTVIHRDTNGIWGPVRSGVASHTRESATDRVRRVSQEEGIPLFIKLDTGNSELLGPQDPLTASDIIQESADTDLGMVYDSRQANSLEYRPRESLYNQIPVELSFCDDPVVDPFTPTDDDSHTANDVTVTRRRGSSYRATRDDGPMSTGLPPHGIGRYEQAVTLPLADDGLLSRQAHWRLHMGTVNEVRYPQITLDLHHRPEIASRVAGVDLWDRITVTDLPPQLPPDDADLIVQGISEYMDGIRWTWTASGSPASVWRVGVTDDSTYGRADTAGSQLIEAVDSDSDSLAVLATSGPRWTVDPEQFPFDVRVGGEVVTVTLIQPLLSDDFGREDVGRWDIDTWDDTLIWS